MSTRKIVPLVVLLIAIDCLAGHILHGGRSLTDPTLERRGSTEASESTRVLVYYFHGYVRCSTCRRIEMLAHLALQQEFSGELEDGRLQWQAVNIDEDPNAHFVDDYRLFSRALVVQTIRDGKKAEWKNLNRIWELIGDEMAFVKYVQDEVGSFLEGTQ